MGILIDAVRIANFRAIEKLEIHLSDFNILVGANNSGKTTLLRALHLALGEGRKSISREDFHIRSNKSAEEIVIDVRIVPVDESCNRIDDFDNRWSTQCFTVDQIFLEDGMRQVVAFRTRISLDNGKSGGYAIERFSLKSWDEWNNWPLKNSELQGKVILDAIPLFYIDAQRDILNDLRDRNSYLGKIVSKIHIDDDKIKEIEHLLKNLNEEIKNASDELRHLSNKLSELGDTIGTGETNVEITPVHKKMRDLGKGLNIHLSEKNAETLPLEYHGMGTRSWASLLTVKAFISWLTKIQGDNDSPFHPILALEEPEAHLHPNGQRHLLTQLLSMDGQKIISTHSPFIASRVPVDKIRLFYRSDTGTAIGVLRQDSVQADKDVVAKIKREIINTKGELLFAKCVVLCEGITEEQMLPIFAEHFWKKSPAELGICFSGVGGGKNYKALLTFCKAFHIPWFIFGDSEPDIVKKLNEDLSVLGYSSIDESNNIILVTDGKDIEKHLIFSGYMKELKKAIIEMERPFSNEQHESDKIQKIDNWDEEKVFDVLHGNKAVAAPYIADAIISAASTERKIPQKVNELFESIENKVDIIRR